MSYILTQDDYKRFEELLEQMMEEYVSKRHSTKEYWQKREYHMDADSIERTLELMKERKSITLRKKE